MKFNQPFGKIFILLTVIFAFCFFKTAIADEKPAQIPTTAEIKSLPATPSDIKPSVVTTSPGKLNRNTLGCVLPLSGQYADWGNKAKDAILLATEIVDEKIILYGKSFLKIPRDCRKIQKQPSHV